MLSIDTAVGGAQCDLLSGPGLDSLMRIVQTGIITGSLSGTPCETWSAARHLQLPPQLQAKWPGPLRSSDRAWGIAFLTQRELQQLATGSALMLLSSPSCFRVVRHSRDPTLSSQRSYVQWGCLAPATILHKQAVPGLRKPTCTLAGRDEQTGQFRTACAKEYPAELCRALVVTLSQGLHGKSNLKGLLPANYPSSKSGIATGWTVWPTSLPPVFPAIFFRTTSQSAKSLLLTAFKTARGTGPSSCRMNEKIWKNQTCILLLHLFSHINWHIWRHRCSLLPDPLPAQLQPRLPPTACDIVGSDGSVRYGLSRGRAGHGAMAGVSEPKRGWEAALGAWDPSTFSKFCCLYFFDENSRKLNLLYIFRKWYDNIW